MISDPKGTIKITSIALDPKIWHSVLMDDCDHWKVNSLRFPTICSTFFYAKGSQSNINFQSVKFFGLMKQKLSQLHSSQQYNEIQDGFKNTILTSLCEFNHFAIVKTVTLSSCKLHKKIYNIIRACLFYRASNPFKNSWSLPKQNFHQSKICNF